MPTLSEAQLADYHRDGFVIVPGLFGGDEVELLSRVARADQELNSRAREMADASGAGSRISLDWQLGDDLFSTVARCRRLYEGMRQVLGGEPLHFHHKMMMKEAHGGGAWEWHQDYGYWYHDTFPFPHLASCMIAVDRATRENGCLQVLRGAHLAGRVEHDRVAMQVGADPARIAMLEQVCERVYAELAPGDALFFHSNTPHRSDVNASDHPRWAFICCYTRADNLPADPNRRGVVKEYQVLDDAEVLRVAREHPAAVGG